MGNNAGEMTSGLGIGFFRSNRATNYFNWVNLFSHLKCSFVRGGTSSPELWDLKISNQKCHMKSLSRPRPSRSTTWERIYKTRRLKFCFSLSIGWNKIVHQENNSVLVEILVSLFSCFVNPFPEGGETQEKYDSWARIFRRQFSKKCTFGSKSVTKSLVVDTRPKSQNFL